MARNYHLFDCIIVGSGAAGSAALKQAISLSANSVLIEPDNMVGSEWAVVDGMQKALAAVSKSDNLNESGVLKALRRQNKQLLEALHVPIDDVGHYRLTGHVKVESPQLVRLDGKLLHSRSIILAPCYTISKRPMKDMTVIGAHEVGQLRQLPQDILVDGDSAYRRPIVAALNKLGKNVKPLGKGEGSLVISFGEATCAMNPAAFDKVRWPLDLQGMPRFDPRTFAVDNGTFFIAPRSAEDGKLAVKEAFSQLVE